MRKSDMISSNSMLLFWISPVLGFISAMKNLMLRRSRLTLFLFCLCFGLCFSVGLERVEGSADGISMRIEFEQYKGMSTTQYENCLSEYFEFDTGLQDIYIVTISYLVGRLSDNYHFFFFALAFVFAFFQLRCLKYFVKEKNFTNSMVCIILACLFLWNNIYNINGARFWTASWMALLCLFKVFYDKKLWYILFSVCLPMVHASFAIFPVLLLIAYFLSKYERLWMVLFCISWGFSFFAMEFSFFSLDGIELPFAIARKVSFYTDKENIMALYYNGSGFYWVSRMFSFISRNYVELLILLIVMNQKHISHGPSRTIVNVMVVIATFANFGMVVPTLGRRFFMLNYALVAYSFLALFGDYKYKKIVYILPFAWLMNLFYLFKDVIAVLDFGFILTPIFSVVRYIIV